MTTAFLIDESRSFQEHLKRTLNSRAINVARTCGTLRDGAAALTSAGFCPDLLLVGLTGATLDTYADLRGLHALVPGARLVILEQRLSMKRLRAALHAGACGYLLKDIAPDALVQSLGVVMAGETVFPTRLADLLRRDESIVPCSAEPVPRTAALSWRDTDLLHGLQNGKSVRGIAEDLRISETEARASLRSLLRKLNVSNRTQAAIWAANHGIRPAVAPY